MAAAKHVESIAEMLAKVPLTDPETIPPDGDDADAFMGPDVEVPDGPPPIDDGGGSPNMPGRPPGGGHRHFKLTKGQRVGARDRAMRAAVLALVHSAKISYTQGPRRWEGINGRCRAAKGQYPRNADCSSFATWCLWDALLMYGAPDVVNGASWRAGFTGTQLSCGSRVTGKVMRGDLAIYGHGNPGKHVAICVGDGLVISHGSNAGPMKLKLHYRSDLMEVRRYF